MNNAILKHSCLAALAVILLLTDCAQHAMRVHLTKELAGANLSGYDFYNLRLPDINLTKSSLCRTNLSFTILTNAIMVNADLRGADLSAADLTGADLRGANFRNAILHNAVMRRANLIDAYFYGADLSGADLRQAILMSDTYNAAEPGKGRQTDNVGPMFFVHLRNADMAGSAISIKMKDFIAGQNVRNFNKIIWIK